MTGTTSRRRCSGTAGTRRSPPATCFALRRRFHTLVDAAGLDEDLARDWVVVRMVYNMVWELEDSPDDPDREWLTKCVAICKAVQD